MDLHERLSAKLSKFRPSLTLALKRLAQERLSKNLPVYDFGLGETKGQLDREIRDAGERAFRDEHTMYTDPAGLPELRAAVLKWLNCEKHYTPENVIISAGAKQSLFNIFLAICNPADCVLFDAAPWVSYQPLATAAYAFPVQVLPINNPDTMKITGADLTRNFRMRPHVKLFLLNSPVNPTAQLYNAQEIDDLLSVCVEHRVFFVLDRLYWRIVFDGGAYPEPRIDEETSPWLIQVDGLSKNFRRTGGMRIGWCVAPDDVAAAMVNLQSHYTAGPATPTQRAALAAITTPYRNDMVTELQSKRDLLYRETQEMPLVKIWRTPASFYSFWDVRACFGRHTASGKTLKTSDDVAAYLLNHAGVITASGSGFMQDGYLRLSFATPDDQIIGGMRAMRAALGELR
jgi:aspartate aminotransferase